MFAAHQVSAELARVEWLELKMIAPGDQGDQRSERPRSIRTAGRASLRQMRRADGAMD